MTINIGWHFGGCVFLIADTAVKHQRPPYADSTSFQERAVVEKTYTIEESNSKIIPVNAHTVAAVAGDLGRAAAFLEELKHERHSDVGVAISIVANGRRTHEHGDFHLLVATHDGERTRLLRFSSTHPDVVTDVPELLDLPDEDGRAVESTERGIEALLEHVAVVGGADTGIDAILRLAIPVITTTDVEACRVLVGVVALLQSLGTRRYLLEHGIGGTILGAVLTSRGVEWLPDVTYLMFDTLEGGIPISDPAKTVPGDGPLAHQPERISVVLRDGIAYVLSSYHAPDRIVVLQPHDPAEEGRWSSLPRQVTDRMVIGDHPFVVFLSTRTGDVLVVDRRLDKERYVAVREHGTSITDEVRSFFSPSPSPGAPAKFGFLPEDFQQHVFERFAEIERRRARNRRKREIRRRRH
jgi:hypothetical protein